MLRPSMNEIIPEGDNYYEFVVKVARRARDIASHAEADHFMLEEKPVKIAVEDFAEDAGILP